LSRLAESQSRFAAAILDPDLPVPPDLSCLGAAAAPDRFAVYRNNAVVGLTEALRDAYPVICRLVGDEFFRAMAGVFARAHPPTSPVMLEYGAGFAEFIAAFPPAESVPYLADVARLERAWVEAYHAPDAPALQHLDAAVPVALHPAARLVRSPFPILAIWEANLGDKEPQPMTLADEGDNVLVTRPTAEVRADRVSDASADVIEALAAGRALRNTRRLTALGAFGALTGRR
jgi:hypothetical protein